MMDGKRVLVAGLFHETHSFLDGRTRLEDFSIQQGADLFGLEGNGSPLSAVLEAGKQAGWTIVPALDMRAMPGPVVEDRAVEWFWSALKSALENSNGLDGIFIIMHGAMLSESVDDVEGELLSRIRNLPGYVQTPLCLVLDLHANVTSRMARDADLLVAYRENPHTDAKDAAMRAVRLFARLMEGGERPETVWEHPSIMWPPTGTATADEPMHSLESLAREIEQSKPEILVVNVFAGFAFADVKEAGVSFTATTLGNPKAARLELQRICELAERNRELGNVIDPPLSRVLPTLFQHKEGPILLVEPSDNIGAGAPGSGNSLLRGLLEYSVTNAAVIINDPMAVAALADKHTGEFITLRIGGQGSSTYSGAVTLQVELVSTSEGCFELEDSQSHLASMLGTHIDMGACAVVRHKGIRILLTTRKTPPFDLGQLRSQGVEPAELFAIGVKAAVAHRRAYDPIAKATYTVDTPGPCTSDLKSLPYKKVQRPVYPLDS